MNKPDPVDLAAALNHLRPKDKAPGSARVLNSWITQAERHVGCDGGRLGWLVASTVVAAALQQAVDTQGRPLFLLKGGTLLQHRLPRQSRATTDLDGLIRGDLDTFIDLLDHLLARPWGPCQLRRNPVELIEVPNRAIKPRRFDILVLLNGVTWRRVQVEVSADEGSAGTEDEEIPAPSLAGLGLPTPDHLTGLAMRYQIAQKVHAASDPHDPPAVENDRARDVVDLLLLRDLISQTGQPSYAEVRAAILDIFAARAREAAALGLSVRTWPTRITAHRHWGASFSRAAQSVELGLSLDEAVAQANTWLDELDAS
ncbi:MAG: nucleotidyl transferase AbiEii/AbiGii toxin family protein [Propionibacteriaceae bacterium]|nr:nucleotidyl transferase AbiEii/AbiGii toxin family protein [Micropruina sp.]HBX82866.1 hypothetical protein [Propionibacteriaceae bacterium]HBY23385.1 hypothetical protein [Propionibacteriaceae bacterium]